VNRNTTLLLAGLTFILQFYLSEFMTIRSIRPDFLLIFIVYVSFQYGSFAGVIAGFSLGLLEDLSGVGSMFGLAPLTKSITGFLIGKLQGQHSRMNPLYFHATWIGIIFFHFVFYIYFRFQTLYETSSEQFFLTWLFSAVYTLALLGLMQVVKPIGEIRPLE
jgi:rod shape-determining protein MreD